MKLIRVDEESSDITRRMRASRLSSRGLVYSSHVSRFSRNASAGLDLRPEEEGTRHIVLVVRLVSELRT